MAAVIVQEHYVGEFPFVESYRALRQTLGVDRARRKIFGQIDHSCAEAKSFPEKQSLLPSTKCLLECPERGGVNRCHSFQNVESQCSANRLWNGQQNVALAFNEGMPL
jgi:hypothetical protein